jgi:putative Mg2+ transporter-C (MgtC) family protein
MVGVERELSGKPAGLRTNILICLGSALLMDLSITLGMIDGERVGDPARIAAQVVTGVGFLGAGTILHRRTDVVGLTTAAGIWASAGIGMAVGMGLYVLAIGGSGLILAVLWLLGILSSRIGGNGQADGRGGAAADDEDPSRPPRFDRPEDVART